MSCRTDGTRKLHEDEQQSYIRRLEAMLERANEEIASLAHQFAASLNVRTHTQ